MSLRGAILQIKRKKAPFFIKKNDYKGMSIEINCTGSDTIKLHELTEFQGELKERSAGDVEKIIKSIKKHGFSFPFFVWKNDGKNNVLDGHGHLIALKQMAAAGEEIPALPCVYINAKDEAEAKEKLLKLNSQYGHMTADSVAAFLGDIKIDFAVLDPFGGSGTSIIACEKLNRTAYVMELDPHYCDVIRKRWTKWAEENGVDAGSGALE